MSCSCLELILLARSDWLINGFDFVVVMALMFVLPAGQTALIFLGCFVYVGKLALSTSVNICFFVV